MKTNISLPDESFVWGKPDKTPDNSTYLRWALFWGILLMGIATYRFEGWVMPDLIVALYFYRVTAANHFRLDSVIANAGGLRVAYSHIPKFAGDYVNEKILILWGDVSSIKKEDDGEGSCWVGITLKNPLVSGNTHLKLTCASEGEAVMACNKLQSLAGHLFKEPKI